MKAVTSKWDGKDHFLYKNHVTMQSPVAIEIFDEFFKYNTFDTIIEIGTAGGGWSIFLKEHSMKMGASFITYDIQNNPKKRDEFTSLNIDFRLKDVLEPDVILEIQNLIYNSGRVALFCDGGDKIQEFNLFSSMLRTGDFILAHDYSPTYQYLTDVMRSEYWGWGEIMDEHISECMERNGIIKFMPEYFIPSAWIATIKNT